MQQDIADVAVYGLGFVGLTLAVALADAGYRVVGLEIRQDLRGLIRAGRAPFLEPHLSEGIVRNLASGALSVEDADASVKAAVHIITVGTPLDESGKCRLDMISRVTSQIATQLRDGDLVCLRSTVRVGTTRGVVKTILDSSGASFKLAYAPERTLEGNALRELTELPQVVGGLDDESTSTASAFFSRVTSSLVRVSSLEVAELIKLTDNAFRDVRFAFSNEIASIAGAWNVDGDEVLRAARLGYPRTSVADAGPVGGPCLSKDGLILAESAEMVEQSADLALAARKRNLGMTQSVSEAIDGRCPQRGSIAVLGLAFKGTPATDDTRDSPVLKVLEQVLRNRPDCKVLVFDPCDARPEETWWDKTPSGSKNRVFFVNEWQEACASANVVLIGNDHPSILDLPLTAVAEVAAGDACIIDFWSSRRADAGLRAPAAYLPWFSARGQRRD